MTVVFAHMLYPNFALAVELLEENENLYFDITNVMGYLKKEAFDHENIEIEKTVPFFENTVNRFSNRIMFGSEHPIGTGSIEEVYDDIKYFDISAQAKADIFFNTAFNFVERFWPRHFDS
jgi:predicted TIM-barrel fold metal-dependent hydrolase